MSGFEYRGDFSSFGQQSVKEVVALFPFKTSLKRRRFTLGLCITDLLDNDKSKQSDLNQEINRNDQMEKDLRRDRT